MEYDLSTLGPIGLLVVGIVGLAKALEHVIKTRKEANGLGPVLQNDLEHFKGEFDRLRDSHTELERTVGVIRSDVRVLLDRGGIPGKD